MRRDALPDELKDLVHQAVATLGKVIRRETGPACYRRIEALRRSMAALRGKSVDAKFRALQAALADLESLSPRDRRAVAKSFALMMQVMNACENAYRTHRLRGRDLHRTDARPGAEFVTFVLTSHPTEARSPANIAAFHALQRVLARFLDAGGPSVTDEADLWHALEVAWRAPLTRVRSPRVADEAEHIYSLLLRDEILWELLELGAGSTRLGIRTWVGGDKDGHPGVDAKVMRESLALSRAKLLRLGADRLREIQASLSLWPARELARKVGRFEKNWSSLHRLKAGDGGRVRRLRDEFERLQANYLQATGARHPALRDLERLFATFPALLVPLELREASDVLMAKHDRPLAIDRMLAELSRLARGGDPIWYARGFIISMTDSIAHIRKAAAKQKAAFGDIRLPIVPLFEQTESLRGSAKIVRAMVRDARLARAARRFWQGRIEIMVGYSDSAKEGGVLASRLAIAEALPRLERACRRAGFTPIFFHGSGGSIDRGGGSIQDQTAWWPPSALKHYKVTVQGEMIERTFASPAIARGQFEHIRESAARGLGHRPRKFRRDPALEKFAARASTAYRERIQSPEFLNAVSAATLYNDLSLLKIGSRPVKRSATLTVAGLRAIPWILCWTQARVLFPTWWGIGSAWRATPRADRDSLRRAFRQNPLFASYVKALGFTLAKIELAVWRLHLAQSSLSTADARKIDEAFRAEHAEVEKFYRALTGHRDWTWFRPWLGESIRLRSDMIHPLNLLQILAERQKDAELLRLTVTGIASGMLTTG